MLEYVPVTVLPTMTYKQDVVIFGTNVLQQFLSTLDFPNRQLILSPRGNAVQRKLHLAKLPTKQVRVPFFVWGDHNMFTRGALGRHDGLSFVFDPGFVSKRVGSNQGFRQATLTTSKERLRTWGFPEETVNSPAFGSSQALFLGPLEQKGYLLVPGDISPRELGGVRIHGLLSHAILQRYAWTLDFTDRVYIFSSSP